MNYKYLSLEDAKKLENYDKLLARCTESENSRRLLALKINKLKKIYTKNLEEKDKRIKELENELSAYRNKQMDIFGG